MHSHAQTVYYSGRTPCDPSDTSSLSLVQVLSPDLETPSSSLRAFLRSLVVPWSIYYFKPASALPSLALPNLRPALRLVPPVCLKQRPRPTFSCPLFSFTLDHRVIETHSIKSAHLLIFFLSFSFHQVTVGRALPLFSLWRERKKPQKRTRRVIRE